MAILDVRNLSVDYLTDDPSASSGQAPSAGRRGELVEPSGRRGTALRAVEGVSFGLEQGRSLGMVGESGCGKTTAMLGVLRLLPAEGRIVSGEVWYRPIQNAHSPRLGGVPREVDLLRLSEREMRKYRWSRMSIVFQGAMNALNPVRKVGDQIAEVIMLHGVATDKKAAGKRVGELLEMVGIIPEMARQYPHQYSGGMRQRAMIAMALSCSPDILIADEPTTALDVMIQAQILDLLQNLQQELELSIILVTHDLGVVAEICDDVLVMYGGKTAEYASVDVIYNEPLHPYTQRLLQAFPDVDSPSTTLPSTALGTGRAGPASTLASIPGHPPPLDALPPGCRFEPRCHCKSEICAVESPPLLAVKPGHYVACHRVRG
jgi:peptide/nickel transport system ATP-binding protein